jgi:hypothetical protein
LFHFPISKYWQVTNEAEVAAMPLLLQVRRMDEAAREPVERGGAIGEKLTLVLVELGCLQKGLYY